MTMQPAHRGGIIPPVLQPARMRIAREYAQLGQVEFSMRTGISRATISAAETGKTRPSKATLNHWALATGVSLHWLVNGETPSAEAEGVPEEVHPPGLEPGTHWLRDNVTYLGVAA